MGWSGTCGKPAKMRHNNKFYCGVHDPVKREAKREEREAAWRVKWNEKNAVWARRDKIQAAQKDVIAVARAACQQAASWDDVAAAVARLNQAEAAP